jgi:hypothetical protein
MRQFAKRRNETLRKGAMFNFSAGSGCTKLWELEPRTSSTGPTIMALLASGFQERDYHDVFGVFNVAWGFPRLRNPVQRGGSEPAQIPILENPAFDAGAE